MVAFALLMFAANSLLARMALGAGSVDASTYSGIRLLSGAVMLMVLGHIRHGGGLGGSWSSAFLLFLYAVPFSFAYLGLTTGTGALILFGCVQVTMIAGGWYSGERPVIQQWVGLLVALAGLVFLLIPGIDAPRPLPAFLMAVAGISWGVYSLRGRSGGDPFLRTKGNFIRSVPMVVLIWLFTMPSTVWELKGILLAILSGALASALGYVAWYAALKELTAMKASVLQLAVPVLAAISGAVVLAEPISLRLVIASLLVLGGVAMTLKRA
jgi:drug/metabolite transporter (DMT)-like permease